MESSIETLWKLHREGASPADLGSAAHDSRSLLYAAVLSFAAGDHGSASDFATRAASASPVDPVATAAASYLTRVNRKERGEVYSTDPAAFASFINGGGNVELYRRLTRALRSRYEALAPSRLLDLGAGDGSALVPVVTGTSIAVEVIEPSSELSASLAKALDDAGVPHRIRAITAQAATLAPMDRVDIAQTTFCLHNLSPSDRAGVLSWLRSVCDRLVVAEFDVAARSVPEPAWFATVVDRYANGLAEYRDDGGLVEQGFLMPVMFGYFDVSVDHHEVTAEHWIDELKAAGFDHCEVHQLYDYWWAPAVLLEAS